MQRVNLARIVDALRRSGIGILSSVGCVGDVVMWFNGACVCFAMFSVQQVYTRSVRGIVNVICMYMGANT